MMVPIAAVVMSLLAKSSMQETRVELGRLGQRSEHVLLFTLLMTSEAQVGDIEIFSSGILDTFSSFVKP